MSSILVVEDDAELASLLQRLLESEGHTVTLAHDGHRALHLALTSSFDLLVVDRGLPAIEGLDLVSRLRAKGVATPVLILSARGTTQDRVEGLDAGAEDYLPKPFDVSELLARVRALLRRHRDEAAALPIHGGVLLWEERVVRLQNGSRVELSERETALLRLLASRPSQVFSRDSLLDLVFADAESDGAIDTYVHYLRRKLGRGVVSTVRGVGYRLGTP